MAIFYTKCHLASRVIRWGFVGYHRENGDLSLSIATNFGDREVSFACADQSEALSMRRKRREWRESTPVFEYWVWGSRTKIENCLSRPLAMTVDGKVYRLDTKLLRRAVENAIDRATDE